VAEPIRYKKIGKGKIEKCGKNFGPDNRESRPKFFEGKDIKK
jgi:hypothetical protein